MFTGIVETVATVRGLERSGTNVTFEIESSISAELKIDQSVAHNGACLTVVAIDSESGRYKVTAINETLEKTNLGDWKEDTKVNLERCVRVDDRLDGHIVQGHVDTIGTVQSIVDEDGSSIITIGHPQGEQFLTVEKGSICVNGISLTVVDSGSGHFSVAIIPYTMEHTNLHTLKEGSTVNLEFDILGKYIAKMMAKKE